MEDIDLQEISFYYDVKFFSKVQELTERRKNLRVTQFQIAHKLDKSLKTIQNFEALKCKDYFLVFAYTKLLKK